MRADQQVSRTALAPQLRNAQSAGGSDEDRTAAETVGHASEECDFLSHVLGNAVHHEISVLVHNRQFIDELGRSRFARSRANVLIHPGLEGIQGRLHRCQLAGITRPLTLPP